MLCFGTAQASLPLSREGNQTKDPISKPATKFMFHLHPWQLFAMFVIQTVFTVYPHIYSKNNVLNKDMSGEHGTQNNISSQVTGSLVAGCQSDNDLQAVSQHVGEHMGPWAASKRHVFSRR